jgi:hypothetical protein
MEACVKLISQGQEIFRTDVKLVRNDLQAIVVSVQKECERLIYNHPAGRTEGINTVFNQDEAKQFRQALELPSDE